MVGILLVSGMYLYPSVFMHSLERRADDMMMRWSPSAPYSERLHFLGIDQPSYAGDVDGRISQEEVEASISLQHMTENFPWNRTVWADAIERLIDEAGAEVVVLDLLLENPADGDEQLRDVVDRYRDQVVLASRMERQDFGGNIITRFIPPAATILGPEARAESFSPDGRPGHVNLWPSPWDGVVRDILYRMPWDGDNVAPALSARAVQRFDDGVELPPAGVSKRIRYSGPPSTYPPRPIFEIFVESLWENNYLDPGRFEGDIVLIGPSGTWQDDFHPSPMAEERMPGPEIHLNAMAAAMEEAYLIETHDGLDLVFIALLGLLGTGVFLAFASTLWKLLGFVAGGLGYFGVVIGAFEGLDLVLPLVFPMTSYGMSGLGTFGYQFVREQREKLHIRGTLERYLSRDVASEILDQRNLYYEALGGQRKTVTILFSDIRDFTPIAEQMPPARLVEQLNEFLTPMVDIIQDRKGRLDKIVGDAIMAVWGDLFDRLEPDEEVEQSVRAALDMLDRVKILNKHWKEDGKPTFEIGIGVVRGEAVFGNLGSANRMELTVVGDAVNQASRFEELTKTYGIELLVGEEVHHRLPADVLSFLVDRVRVRGKQEPTEVYGVLGSNPETERVEAVDRFRQAWELYNEGEFSRAGKGFGVLVDHPRLGELALHYVQRCETLEDRPPEEWDGVWRME